MKRNGQVCINKKEREFYLLYALFWREHQHKELRKKGHVRFIYLFWWWAAVNVGWCVMTWASSPWQASNENWFEDGTQLDHHHEEETLNRGPASQPATRPAAWIRNGRSGRLSVCPFISPHLKYAHSSLLLCCSSGHPNHCNFAFLDGLHLTSIM